MKFLFQLDLFHTPVIYDDACWCNGVAMHGYLLHLCRSRFKSLQGKWGKLRDIPSTKVQQLHSNPKHQYDILRWVGQCWQSVHHKWKEKSENMQSSQKVGSSTCLHWIQNVIFLGNFLWRLCSSYVCKGESMASALYSGAAFSANRHCNPQVSSNFSTIPLDYQAATVKPSYYDFEGTAIKKH